MLSFKLAALLGLALTPLSLAHFVVNIPPPLVSDIANQDSSPCGGATPSSSDKGSEFHVGGDAIGITTLHPQSYFAYRGMLGTSISSPNWTTLLPTIQEFGLNGFCQPSVVVPASWAGSSGMLQVIQSSGDGVHYGCMVVNFVEGKGTPPSTCTNSSGVSAQFASDDALTAIESPGSSSPSSTQGTSSPTSSSPSSPSESNSAAILTTSVQTIAGSVLALLFCALLNM